MRKQLAKFKQQLITLGGLRSEFTLEILEQKLTVDYNLRSIEADRDYAILAKLAKGKRCIFDVGANHGIISLLMVAQDPGAIVHAFEASEAAVNVINHNVLLNGFSKSIRVINTLVADRSGYTIPFYWEGSSGGASIVKGRLGHVIEIHKSTLSLDDYAKAHDTYPDFIKMDIEGAENIAVTGMQEILRLARPDIFIELHDFGSKKLFENANDILSIVKPLDYHMIYLRTGRPIENTEVLKDRGRCHVLLQPREKYSAGVFDSLDLHGL
jgi:FkbM family methyltransferase